MSIDPLFEEPEAGSEVYPHSINISDYVFPNVVTSSSVAPRNGIIENPQDITDLGGWLTPPANLPNAKDNDFNTSTTEGQSSNDAIFHYLRADFGSKKNRQLRVKWRRRFAGASGGAWTIDTSDDGSAWTTRYSGSTGVPLDVTEDLANVFSGKFRYVRTGVRGAGAGNPTFMTLFEVRSEGELFELANSIDNDVLTTWQSTSELNPFLRGEFSTIADKEPSAIAIYVDKSKISSLQFLIQTSLDGVAWTTKRTINITQLTDLAYNFIRFNRDVLPIRYIRLVGNDSVAIQLAINEYKALIPTATQWADRQAHKTISPTSTSIGLAG